MKRTAILFDLDGTLVDSVPDIAAALNHTVGALGLAPFSGQETTRMVGTGSRRLIDQALKARGQDGDPALLDRALAAFLEFYQAHPCDETRVFPGVEDALSALRSHGFRLAVCTNKPEPIAVLVLERLGLTPLVDGLVGGRPGLALKPAPDMLLRALETLGATPDTGIFVGDSPADVTAARAAHLPIALLSHGYSNVPAERLGADVFVPDFAALPAAIARLVGP